MADILQAIIWNWYSSLKKVEFWFKFHSPVKNRSCSESTRCCVQCVIPLIWYPSVFLTDGSESSGWDFGNNNGRRKVSLRFWGWRSKLGSNPWSNSLRVGIYHAASARRHVLIFPQYKMISERHTDSFSSITWNQNHFRDEYYGTYTLLVKESQVELMRKQNSAL